MAFINTYQLTFQNNEGNIVTINISDTLSGVGTPVFTNLKTVKAELKVVSDDEDKFSIIKSKRIEFSFLPTSTVKLSTFLSAADDQYLVEAFIGATPIFSGWLVTDATREAFMPVEHKYPVELTASDNLGLLKDIPLTKPDGTNPRGRFRWIDYISWSLRKTGFDFPIKVVYGLLPDNYVSGDNSFDKCYLSAKSFEADINESVDCYEAIQRILKGCFLTQHQNEWWIVRVDELNGTDLRVYSFTYDGTLTGDTTVTLSLNIGKTENIKLINKDAEVMPERPIKYAKPTYKFEFPREIIDNYDFSRGTTWVSPFVVDLSLFIRSYSTLGAFPAQGEFGLVYKATGSGIYYKWSGAAYLPISGAEIPQGFAYVIDDWTLVKQGGGSPSINAYVVKIRQYGDEKERYVLMTSGATQHWLKSNRVPLGRFDKFTFSVDRRLTQNLTGSGISTEFFAQIRLFGEDGTFWTVTNIASGNEVPGNWIQTNSSFSSNSRFITVRYTRNQVDETKWMNGSVDADPVPVNGEIEILLWQNSTGAAAHFSNIQFEYIPYINGSYQKYTGQYNKVSQTVSTKAKREETVLMSDSPKKLFKGAIELKTGGGQYYLAENFYNVNAGTSGELGKAKFGKYQAFEIWNQFNRVVRKMQGSLKGLNTDNPTDMPSLLHQYVLTASSEHTTNKQYMLLSYSQDLDTCKWSGVFAEVYDSVADKLYNSDHEFKYTME